MRGVKEGVGQGVDQHRRILDAEPAVTLPQRGQHRVAAMTMLRERPKSP
jgi:hypothetical protein